MIKELENMFDVTADADCKVNAVKLDDEKIKFDFEWKNNDGEVNILFSIPCIDIECVWEPTCIMNRNYNITSFSTSLMGAIPLIAYCNNKGNSVYAIATSETVKKIDYQFKMNEYTAEIDCSIGINLKQFENANTYSFVLYIQTEEKPLYEACHNVSLWWEQILDIKESKCFNEIALPGYNTWYSYHHNFNQRKLLEECKSAKELGMKIFILDDGWQTDELKDGCMYSGDWEPAESKIPDMKAFVDEIHSMDMKMIIWFSFSFVGFKSKLWDKYKDRILATYDDLGVGILDPRYPKIREYLAQKYEIAVKEWGVDGFKFDFIDAFRNYKEYEKKEGMDYAAVEDAVEALLNDVTSRIKKIKDDIIIECRQGYTGPYIRHYANYLGPIDSPDYYRQNRVGTVDLRMTSGKTLVYSDMLMWNKNEPVQKAALQVLNAIFTLLHFSVRINDISDEHKKMIKFWIDFSVKNRELLLQGNFKPLEMQNFYPVITVDDDNEAITAVYAINKIIDVDINKKNTVINACESDEVVIRAADSGSKNCTVFDCMGNFVEKISLDVNPGIISVKVPQSGLVIIE